MAKKGQAIQLQTEVNNDEDWEKLLQKDGLIIVDVYSEWCGPCSGMAANLKKIKLEIGGDLLQLAIAKADNITALQRFRNKSEPTWMFIVNGKMVNFMFGANAPKLTRLIIDELRKEKEAREGRRERVQNEISDLMDEEKERLEVIENAERAIKEREIAKARKELHDRRTAEANNILENLNHLGVVIVFPHAKTKYMEAFGDLLGEAGLTITQTEKNYNVTEQQLAELFYFLEDEDSFPFPEESLEQLLNNPVVILLIKPIPARNVTEPTDDLLLEIIYGPMKRAPGSPNSAAQVLSKVTRPTDDGGEETITMVGCWTPEQELIKATALRLFFGRLTEHYIIPEPEPTPPHYAVVFDSYRRAEVAALMDKYNKEVLRYGFFTSEKPEEAKLVAKSIYKYDKAAAQRGPDEQIVLKLSKADPDIFNIFIDLGPTYASLDAIEGEKECLKFFPADYAIPEEIAEEVKKKPKRRSKTKTVTPVEDDTVTDTAVEQPTDVEDVENAEDELECAINDEEEEEEEEVGDGIVSEADKATSPMENEANE